MPKCMICGKDVDAKEATQINGAVTGEGILIQGHDKCIRNVDRLVVIPNRNRVNPKVSDFDLLRAVGCFVGDAMEGEIVVCPRCLTDEERLEIRKKDLVSEQKRIELEIWKCFRCGEILRA